jgi:outer membrane protein assembly factor BamA
MVRTFKPLAIFLLSLAPVAAFSQNSECPTAAGISQDQQTLDQNLIKLRNVQFTGNPVLSREEQEQISSAVCKDPFGPHYVREELKASIRSQWQQRGYFKVVAGDPDLRPDTSDPNSLIATVRVDAGKQYRLAELRFLKNTAFPAEKLSSLFPIQTGDVFNTHKVGKGIEEVRKLYGENGYINMSVVPTTEWQNGDNRVNLTIELDEGSQFRVGKVEVIAADEAKRRQFVSQAGLITGSIYDSLRLQKAFASGESDGFNTMVESVMQSINEADSTVDFKVDLRPCVAMSQK